MRLFVAIDPDAPTRAWIAASQRRLRGELARFGRALRWADPATLHLTLVFLGEVPDAEPVAAALETCAFEPMELGVGGLGVFPNARRPSVLWTGVGDRSGLLGRLQGELARVLTPFVEPERRGFAPHLTLARVKGFPPRGLGEAVAALAAGWDAAPGPWRVDRFALVQSTLDARGARHTVLREFR